MIEGLCPFGSEAVVKYVLPTRQFLKEIHGCSVTPGPLERGQLKCPPQIA